MFDSKIDIKILLFNSVTFQIKTLLLVSVGPTSFIFKLTWLFYLLCYKIVFLLTIRVKLLLMHLCE